MNTYCPSCHRFIQEDPATHIITCFDSIVLCSKCNESISKDKLEEHLYKTHGIKPPRRLTNLIIPSLPPIPTFTQHSLLLNPVSILIPPPPPPPSLPESGINVAPEYIPMHVLPASSDLNDFYRYLKTKRESDSLHDEENTDPNLIQIPGTIRNDDPVDFVEYKRHKLEGMIIRLKAEQDQQPSLHSVSLPSLPVLPPSQPQHRPQSEQSQQSQFDIAIFAQSLISNDFSNHPSALNYHFEDYIIRYPDVYDISSILSEMNLSINPTLDEHVEINPPPELSSSSEPSPQSEMQKDDVCAESEVQIDNPASDEASLDSISFITQFCERPQPTQHSIVRYDSQLHDSRRSTTGFADDDEMGGFLPQHDNPLSHRLLCIPSTADNQLLLTLSSTAILASLIHVDLVQAYLKISGLIVESAPISESHPSTPIPSIFSERYPHYPSSLTMISQQISPTVLTHSPLSLPSFTSRTTPFILSSPSSYFFSLPQPCHIADCSSEMLKILTTVVPCLSIPPLEQLHSHLNNTFSLVVPRISENHSSDACLSPTGLRTLVHDLTPLSWEAYVLKCIGWNILPSDFASFYLSDINSSFLEANLRKIPKPNPEWVGSQQFIVLNEPSEPSSIPFSDWANLSKRQKQEFVKARRLVSLLHAAHPKADEGQSDMFNLSTFDKTFIKETSTNVQNKQTPTDFAKTLVEQDRSILDPLETFVALFDFTRDALNSLQELLRFLRDEMDYYAEHNPTDLANPDQVLLSKVDLEEETPPPLPEASLFVGCFSDGFDIPNG